MRKIIFSLLVFVFFSMESFCQDYSFDQFYEYNQDGSIIFFMINSQNPDYVFIGRSSMEYISGNITDFKTNEIHNYEVFNIDDSVIFKYNLTRKMCQECKNAHHYIEPKVAFEYSVDNSDSLKTKVTIVKTKVKKKPKFLAKLEITSDNTDFAFYNLVSGYTGYHFFDSRERIKTINKLPVSIYWEDNYGHKSTTRLTKRKKINTLLSISKEQLTYKE